MLREVQFLSRSNHANIVSFKGAYLFGSEVWIVMEFMEGGVLRDAVHNELNIHFNETQIALVARDILFALQFLHSNGWVHRDLKSSNVMLTFNGRAKLIDFGLCARSENEDEFRHMCGSPFWMAPEMIRGEHYSFPVDIWSFSICLLELSSVQSLKRSAFRSMFLVGTGAEPELAGEWSSDFRDFLGQCLKNNPSQRSNVAMLLEHPWLASNRLATAKEMGEIIKRIFSTKSLTAAGLLGF